MRIDGRLETPQLSRRLCRRIALGAIVAISTSTVAAAQVTVPVTSEFDSGLDGWTKVTGQNSTVTHSATGGNPSGYVHFTDAGSGRSDIQAPAAYLGDWSSLDGVGTLSWDHKIFALGTSPQEPPFKQFEAVIKGNGNQARFLSVATAQMDWTTAVAPIDESEWTVELGTWAALLADVQDLQIRIELVGNDGPLPGDVDGIDNVVLEGAALPVPSLNPLGLVALGTLLLGAMYVAVRRSRRFPAAGPRWDLT